MMCQRMGRPPISTIGLGRNSVSSRRRVPNPPQRTTTFISGFLAAPPARGSASYLQSAGLIRVRIQLSHTRGTKAELRKSPRRLQFEGRDPNWLRCALRGLIPVGEGNVAMAEEAEHD